MNSNIKPSNRAVLLDTIDPDAYSSTTLTTAWFPAKNYGNFMAVVSWGNLGTAYTVNAKLEQSTNTSPMAAAKDVTGKAISAVSGATSPAGANDDGQAIINCRADELDAANDYDMVRLSVTLLDTASPLSGTADASAHLFGLDATYAPGTDDTAVAEVI